MPSCLRIVHRPNYKFKLFANSNRDTRPATETTEFISGQLILLTHTCTLCTTKCNQIVDKLPASNRKSLLMNPITVIMIRLLNELSLCDYFLLLPFYNIINNVILCVVNTIYQQRRRRRRQQQQQPWPLHHCHVELVFSVSLQVP